MKHLLLIALALQAAAPTHAQAGWTIEPQAANVALVYGKPETADAFRIDCSAARTSLSTWTSRRPRNVGEGEFPSSLSVFQGRTELVLGATGRVLPTGGTRIDALIADRDAFLAGVGSNRRVVVVSFAGRAMAPAPTSAQLADFGQACAAVSS